ncbi:MAG: hypothetical protein VXZ35_13655, partial [Pseudomonadota bacterium]|nr:hypothetical protein [Pseudomonadota bacterium]
SYRDKDIFRVVLIFRLAILLNRFRQEGDLLPFACSFEKKSIRLRFGEEWRGGAELFSADLEKEQQRFQKVSLDIEFEFA